MSDNTQEAAEDLLKLDKLRLEVETMRKSLRPWYARPSLLVSTVGAAAAFLAVLIQWRVTAVQVDIAELKAKQAEQRVAEAEKRLAESELLANKSTRRVMESEGRISGLESEAQDLQKRIRANDALLASGLEEKASMDSTISDLRGQLSILREQTAEETIEAQDQLTLKRKDIEDLETLASVLRTEVKSLQGVQLSLLLSISKDQNASADLKGVARDTLLGAYIQKREKLDQLHLPEAIGGRMNAFFAGLDRMRELKDEIQRMEDLWPWLKDVDGRSGA